MKCISWIPLEPIQMQIFARDANDHFYLITTHLMLYSTSCHYNLTNWKSILYWYRALE